VLLGLLWLLLFGVSGGSRCRRSRGLVLVLLLLGVMAAARLRWMLAGLGLPLMMVVM